MLCPLCKGQMVEINTVLGKQVVHASQMFRGDSIGTKGELSAECGLSFKGSREDWKRAATTKPDLGLDCLTMFRKWLSKTEKPTLQQAWEEAWYIWQATRNMPPVMGKAERMGDMISITTAASTQGD